MILYNILDSSAEGKDDVIFLLGKLLCSNANYGMLYILQLFIIVSKCFDNCATISIIVQFVTYTDIYKKSYGNHFIKTLILFMNFFRKKKLLQLIALYNPNFEICS